MKCALNLKLPENLTDCSTMTFRSLQGKRLGRQAIFQFRQASPYHHRLAF